MCGRNVKNPVVLSLTHVEVKTIAEALRKVAKHYAFEASLYRRGMCDNPVNERAAKEYDKLMRLAALVLGEESALDE